MVRRYIQNCHICRYAKASKDWSNGLLKPLPIPFCPWTNITPDFVIGLSVSNSYNAILMVVDHLTKKRHYILYKIDKNGITTKATT